MFCCKKKDERILLPLQVKAFNNVAQMFGKWVVCFKNIGMLHPISVLAVVIYPKLLYNVKVKEIVLGGSIDYE